MLRYPFQNFQALARGERGGLPGWLSVPAKPLAILPLIELPRKNTNCFGCKRNVPQEQQEAAPGALTCLLRWPMLNRRSWQGQRGITCTQTLHFIPNGLLMP